QGAPGGPLVAPLRRPGWPRGRADQAGAAPAILPRHLGLEGVGPLPWPSGGADGVGGPGGQARRARLNGSGDWGACQASRWTRQSAVVDRTGDFHMPSFRSLRATAVLIAALVAASGAASTVSAATFRWAGASDISSMDPYARNETLLLTF